MNIQPYLIPAEAVVFEEEIKKSLFITFLAHTHGTEAAKAFVDQIRKEHPAARHHCWGVVAGRPEDSMQWGFSDDGEPSGTAGKPILAQLSGSGIGEITAVVVRYSGGIKLGTGGLVKAYGGGVQSALKMVQTIEKKITTHLKLRLDYSFISLVQSLISQYDAVEVRSEFSEQIEMVVEIEQLVSAEFIQALINKTGAKVQASELKDN
ncbi:YigZ family protein [Vibrio sp. SCSIO 43137]|uniref:YigZ family protein n=1 Tax=Vibrio sp. SCSIO 43137 TaxID=3021011 RepID=UPI0023073CDF|nr:YigZ family protein [Vibrio sp. SCSIO 43137]WCE29765.1 YigZ family protein [Vibrio sp. SCSIO 43137]